MSRKGVYITDFTKKAVIMKNKKLAKLAFNGRSRGNMYEEEFIQLVRGLCGYSQYSGD